MRNDPSFPAFGGVAVSDESPGALGRVVSESRRGARSPHPTRRLLLVEDCPGDARLVREALDRDDSTGFELIHAERLEAAVQLLGEGSFDLVLLDLGLPDAQGLEAFDSILEAAGETAIIVMSGRQEDVLAIETVQRGAQDYLVKGRESIRSLTRAIRNAIGRNQARQSIRHLAFHDGLTGLPNRRLFRYVLSRAVVKARRDGKRFTLFFLDLDNFKTVNDKYGHGAGDALLRATAQRLGEATRESDTVARLGGDEFALVCPDTAGPEDVAVLVRKILRSLRAPVALSGRTLKTSASIGAALYPDDGEDPEDLLCHADASMYLAKQQGGNRFQSGAPGEIALSNERADLGPALSRALDRAELEVRYQPQVDVRTGAIVGLEVLARWNHPRLGWIPPAEFIRVAEETGRIGDLGEWVLRIACLQGRDWLDAGIRLPRIAVNLSTLQLRQHDLRDRVQRIIAESGLDPGLLELELTRGIRLEERESAAALVGLKSLGVRIALDDFGRGTSGFSALKTCPIDTIKIDPLFVRGLGVSSTDESLVLAMIDVSHELGKRVTAEGIESARQLDFLRRHFCDRAQGNFFSPPLTARAVGPLLGKRLGRACRWPGEGGAEGARPRNSSAGAHSRKHG